jgi:hypothetical protein
MKHPTLVCELCAVTEFTAIPLSTLNGDTITPTFFACANCSAVYFDREAQRPTLNPTLQMRSLATYGPQTKKS